MSTNRDAILKLVIIAHFIFTNMVLMVDDWLPMSYKLNQVAIITLGLWAVVHRESVIQVELMMLVKFLSLIFDSIAIGMHFQIGRQNYVNIHHPWYFALSAFFAIFLLVVKPVMLLLLNKVRQDRLGDTTMPSFGGWGGNSEPRHGYVPVDG